MSFLQWQMYSLTLYLVALMLIEKALSYNFKIPNTNNSLSQELSAFVNFENGDYIIFYENRSKFSYALNMIKYNYENTKVLERELNQFKPTLSYEYPKALLLSEDAFLIQWQSNDLSGKISEKERNFALNAQILDKNLNPLTKPFLLSKEKTLLSSRKTLVKISKLLFAAVYVEFSMDSNAYLVNYSVFCVNGQSVKNERLFITQEKVDLSVTYLNETAFFISFPVNDQKQDNNNFSKNYSLSFTSKVNKALNMFYINHNGIEFDKFINENKNINVTDFLRSYGDLNITNYSTSNNKANYSELISNFNFVFAKAKKLFAFQKHTTADNYNIMTFPKSNILFYNQDLLGNRNVNNSISNDTNSTMVNNNSSIMNSNPYIKNYDVNSTNLIAVISSFDNSTTSYNGLTLYSTKNNSYVQLDILDFDFNLIFTKFYLLENSCCFDSAVFNDNSFLITYQFIYSKAIDGKNKIFSEVAYAEFNSDLTLKGESKNAAINSINKVNGYKNLFPKIILMQMGSQSKLKPRIYLFEKTKNALYDKKLIFAFNALEANKDNEYQLYFSTQDCRENLCVDEVNYLSNCAKSCESCIADPLICAKCASAHYPLIGGFTSNPDFDLLNPFVNNYYSVLNFNNNNNNLNTNGFNNLNSLNNNFLVPSNNNIDNSSNSNFNLNSNFNNNKIAFNCFKSEAPPENSFFDSNIASFVKCNAECNECMNSPSKCVECASGFYPLEDLKGKCVPSDFNFYSETKQAYFLDLKNSIMKRCNLECKKCTTNADNCMECNNEQGFFSISEAAAVCRKNPKGFYLDLSVKLYRKCLENCVKCEDKESCFVCDDYSTLASDGSKCFYCGEGMFYDERIKKCRDCVEVGNCSSCNAEGCFQCRDHFEFQPLNADLTDSHLKSQVTKKSDNIVGTCNNCAFGYILISNNCESILIIVIPIAILIFLILLVIILVIKLRKRSSSSSLSNLNNIILPIPQTNNRNRRIIEGMRARSLKKSEKNMLTVLQPLNDLHDIKCVYGDENPPFWLFDCGGYVCNQCSFRIVAENLKVKHKCPKCDKDLKNFRFLNRYVNAATPQEGIDNNDCNINNENNTIIDLDDVNISGEINFTDGIEMQNVNVEAVNRSKNNKDKGNNLNDKVKDIIDNDNDKDENKNENNEEVADNPCVAFNNKKAKGEREENESDNNYNSESSERNLKNNKGLSTENPLNNNNKEKEIVKDKKETCQICFVLKGSKRIQCESTTPHMICSYCYNRMLKIDKVKVCPFCRTKINKV